MAATALLVLTAMSYVLFVALIGGRIGWTRQTVCIAILVGLLAEPVLRTVQQGQVNLVLAALVVVDVWVLPARWRGSLVGLVAGVKLIPAVFVLYYVARRGWGAMGRAVLAGVATIAVAWVAAPASSKQYWTVLLLDPSRSGGGGYPGNQSLTGVLARLLHNDHPPTLVTLPLQAAGLLLAYLAAWSLLARGQPVAALTAVAVGGLLASPVSWSHHWVWCVPMVMTLLDQRRRTAAVVMAFAFALAPTTLHPWAGSTTSRDPSGSPPQP